MGTTFRWQLKAKTHKEKASPISIDKTGPLFGKRDGTSKHRKWVMLHVWYFFVMMLKTQTILHAFIHFKFSYVHTETNYNDGLYPQKITLPMYQCGHGPFISKYFTDLLRKSRPLWYPVLWKKQIYHTQYPSTSKKWDEKVIKRTSPKVLRSSFAWTRQSMICAKVSDKSGNYRSQNFQSKSQWSYGGTSTPQPLTYTWKITQGTNCHLFRQCSFGIFWPWPMRHAIA